LAVVSVDGINVISGETAAPQQIGYVIDGGQSIDIAGWRKSMARTAAFYFTSLGDSYAARTGRPDNVGVIGVALYRRRAEPVSIAPRESSPYAPPAAGASGSMQDRAEASRAPSVMREKSLGTGHGRSESSHARQVEFERASRFPAERIEIYYDSHASPSARGVIQRVRRATRRPSPARSCRTRGADAAGRIGPLRAQRCARGNPRRPGSSVHFRARCPTPMPAAMPRTRPPMPMSHSCCAISPAMPAPSICFTRAIAAACFASSRASVTARPKPRNCSRRCG
jgi:hypothetical protein